MIISPKKKQLVYEDISQLEELIGQNAVLEDHIYSTHFIHLSFIKMHTI